MPEVLAEKPIPFDCYPNRMRWTIQQCDALREAGFLTEHYELIDGEIISKRGQEPRHTYVINLILTWFANAFGISRVRIQSTLDLSNLGAQYDEPEPDAVLTIEPSSKFVDRHPVPTMSRSL